MLSTVVLFTCLCGITTGQFEIEALSASNSLHHLPRKGISRRIEVRPGSYLAENGNLSRNSVGKDKLSIESFDRLFAKAGSSRIVGGYPAPASTGLHTAFILVLYANGRTGACSGSILDSQRILTAAHCFAGPDGTFSVIRSVVRIGRKVAVGTTYNVRYVDVFRLYYNPTSQNDIAIVWIYGSFKRPFKTVNLRSCTNCAIRPRSFVFAAGYGRTTPKGNITTTLQETGLRVQAYNLCLKTFNKLTKTDFTNAFNEVRILCAMDPGFPKAGQTSVCNGDSGGPLFVKQPNGIVQIGITSFGSKDCTFPGSIEWFVNVTSYVPFIRQHMNNNYFWWSRVYSNFLGFF